MDWLRRSCCVAMLLMLSAMVLHVGLEAQTVPAGYRTPRSLWVGGEYSNFSASFPYQSSQRLEGLGAFVDFKLGGRIGVEGDARFLNFGGYEGSTERSYLAGPKVYLFTKGRFQPYGKFLVGVGEIHYPYEIGNASYFALAPGGGAGYRLSDRWMLRAEYEYQIWPNSPGFANEPKHELTPNGVNVGVAFLVFR
jgi:opacity protein-like surface antigen